MHMHHAWYFTNIFRFSQIFFEHDLMKKCCAYVQIKKYFSKIAFLSKTVMSICKVAISISNRWISDWTIDKSIDKTTIVLRCDCDLIMILKRLRNRWKLTWQRLCSDCQAIVLKLFNVFDFHAAVKCEKNVWN